jgi:E3 ubiquitin-protein ligase HERC2
LQKYAGKDASQLFNSSPYHLSVLQMMENYVVGTYCQPEPELPQSNFDCLHIYAALFDTERNLGYLLGLHAYNLRQSLPLQPDEISSNQWLNAKFLRAGLQVDQPPNPYGEEKGESRSTNSTTENTPTEPKVNDAQRVSKKFQLPIDRINSFINALAESRLSVSHLRRRCLELAF